MVVFRKKPAKVAPTGALQTQQPTDKNPSMSQTDQKTNYNYEQDRDDDNEQQDWDDDFAPNSDDALIPDDAFEFSAEPARPASPAPLLRYADIAAGRPHTNHGTPIEKLVGVFELFVQVLDYLSMKEVLKATQVCRAFKTNIENSSVLKAKLFLAPDLTVKQMAVSEKVASWDTGKLLSGAKAERFLAAVKTKGKWCRTREIALRVLHPALKRDYVSERYKHMGMVKFAETCVEGTQPHDHRTLRFRECMLSAALPSTSSPDPLKKSFDNMLLCQPPVTQVTVHLRMKHVHGHDGHDDPMTIRVRKKTGVTFGIVLSAIQGATGLSRETNQNYCLQGMTITLDDGIVVSSQARRAAENVGELRTEDDPTRWISQLASGEYKLKNGGFGFYRWKEEHGDEGLHWDD